MSICIPTDMPYVNNIWLPRKRGDRPHVVPEGVTNLGLLGQYVELEQDIAFTFEYSTRTAWEAVYRLLKRGPAPPAVYQGQSIRRACGRRESVSGSDGDVGEVARALSHSADLRRLREVRMLSHGGKGMRSFCRK